MNNLKKQGKGCGGRPRRCRQIQFQHQSNFYKPQGVPLRNLETITLSLEELEALRLKNIENKNQNECAKIMKTSQSTFQRILSEAYQKISIALVEGKAIQIT